MSLSKPQTYFLLVILVFFTLVFGLYLHNKRNFQLPSQYGCKECQELYPVVYAGIPPTSRSSHGISFPFKKFVKSLDYILHTNWVQSLQSYLTHLKQKQLFLVSANEKYLETLLNWLSAVKLHTQIQFINILILALDRRIHMSLDKRGIKSILLGDDDIILPGTKFRTHSSHVWIKRCTVTRLLNHWGYDVIMMDLDAIIFKDPRPMFERFKGSDIIGSRGKFPRDLYRQWGMALCMGSVMFRSTSTVERFWETSSVVEIDTQDDQFKINSVFQHLHIKWSTSAECKDISNCTASGITENKLNVTVVSHDLICRSCDEQHTHTYYIWHIHSRKSERREDAKKSFVWFLKHDWKDIWKNPPMHVLGSKLIELLTRKIDS